MISNQVLQNTLEGLKEISRTEFCVIDTDGKVLASTFSDFEIQPADIQAFVESQADSQLVKGFQYFKVCDDYQLEYVLVAHGDDEDTYMVGKLAAFQIQNLLENMIYSLVTGRGNQNRINQTTMGLIFMYLVESVQYVEMRLPNQYENMISMTTLDYIGQKYRTATLTELCGRLHLPMHVLSKMIKKSTGFNFKELLQRKRLNKAVELMCETDLPVSDIIAAVGYENNSYFHRVFKEHYHMTPRAFRVKNSEKEQVRL